jgi:hypothetical protein
MTIEVGLGDFTKSIKSTVRVPSGPNLGTEKLKQPGLDRVRVLKDLKDRVRIRKFLNPTGFNSGSLELNHLIYRPFF